MEQALNAVNGLGEGLELGDEGTELRGDEVRGLRGREGDGGAGKRGGRVSGVIGLHRVRVRRWRLNAFEGLVEQQGRLGSVEMEA